MSVTLTHPSPKTRGIRRTKPERIFDDIRIIHEKMDDLYALAKIKQAELDIENGQCKTYDTIKELLYDLEH